MKKIGFNNVNTSRIWKGKQTMEVFSLEQNEFGLIGGGIVLASDFSIRYKVTMDLFWKVLQVSVEILHCPDLNLQLIRGQGNSWVNELGIEFIELRGAEEIDISLTPFTNTIVMRKMTAHQQKKVKVIFINISEWSLKLVDQQYTLIDQKTFKYENFSTNFSSIIEVDDLGLVIAYPGLFKSLL